MADQLTPEQIKQLQDAFKALNIEHERSLELLKQQIENLKENSEIAKKVAEITKDETSAREAEIQLLMKQEELKAAQILNQKTLNELTKEELKTVTNIAKKVEDYAKELRDIASAKNEGAKLANILGLDEKNQNTLTYRLLSNPKDVFQNFKDEIASAGGVVKAFGATIISNVANQTMEAAKQYANVSAELNKITGAAGSLNVALQETARGATRFGINYKEAGAAIGSLYTNLNTFTEANTATQESLTVSVAKLSQLGISADASAKQIGTLTQIMGISEQRAAKTSEELAGLAVAIGKTPQQVAQDFAAASNSLAAYGTNMVDIFKDIEIQSKATGIAMERIIGIAEKFQTFEGAASAAGRLNAALGGNFVNSMELLEAAADNPSKVIDLLRQRLDATGRSFEEMSFYEKKMIADSAGFSTIEEASRALSMTNAQREKAAKAEADRADAQKKLNEAIEKSIPIQQKFDLIMANFAITMGPLVDILADIISFFGKLIDNPIANFLIRLTVVGAALFTVLNPVVATISALAYAFYLLHDVLLKPHSPILFDSLESLPNIFGNITSSTSLMNAEIQKADSMLSNFGKSTFSMSKTVEVEAIPKLKNMESTTKQLANIDAEKTTNTMKVISNNINSSLPQINQQPQNTIVDVYIGSEKLNQIVNRTVERKVTGTTIALPASTSAAIPR